MNLIERVYNKFFDQSYSSQKISYAQCGEDLIVDFLLGSLLGIKNPIYLDIGAHHPWWLSNTYLFYKRGSSGINVEPDPYLFRNIVRYRPRDININKGVSFGPGSSKADFYIMSSRALNTFSKEEAERLNRAGTYKIEETMQIELIALREIFSKHLPGKELDFLSIDVEGWDLEILKNIDFEKCPPKVICVETLAFGESPNFKKQEATMDFLLENNYSRYADTYINSIFVKNRLF